MADNSNFASSRSSMIDEEESGMTSSVNSNVHTSFLAHSSNTNPNPIQNQNPAPNPTPNPTPNQLSSSRQHSNSTSSTTSKNHKKQSKPPTTSLEQTVLELQKRLDTIGQENRVLKVELDTVKLRYKSANDENRHLKKNSMNIQMRAEMEEEMISNTLLKKIQELKKEKESLVHDYETEEEYLTNDLSRKLNQLRQEKSELETTLEREQQMQVAKLMRRIERMEREMAQKQHTLETLRKEKVDLEQTLEQEQEALVNRLWKRMDKLEREKRSLQEKLNQPVSIPPSPPPEQVNFGNFGSCSSGRVTPAGSNVSVGGGSMGHNSSLGNTSLGHVSMSNVSGTGSSRRLSRERELSASRDLGGYSRDLSGGRGDFHEIPRNTFGRSRDAEQMAIHVRQLRKETDLLKRQLKNNQSDHEQRMNKMCNEERNLREENRKLHETLQLEKERSEQLCRALSESESSLDGSLVEWDRYSSASGYDYLRDASGNAPRPHGHQNRNKKDDESQSIVSESASELDKVFASVSLAKHPDKKSSVKPQSDVNTESPSPATFTSSSQAKKPICET